VDATGSVPLPVRVRPATYDDPVADTLTEAEQTRGSTSAAAADLADDVVQRWRNRLAPPMPADGHWGWTGPLLVTLFAAVLRFVDLGRPRRFVFDETYYAKDAWSLVTSGYAREYVEGANERILDGNLDAYQDTASFVVHPEVGKWLIGIGERLFGMDPFGWRVAVATLGTLMVLVLARLARRLFRSTVLGCTAGLLLAVDGLAIVESRTAILDGILAFFLVAGVACLIVDRDWSRERYARWAATRESSSSPTGGALMSLWRPWRLAAGVSFGLACGTKWSGIWVLAVFGIVTVVWDAQARAIVADWAAAVKGTLIDAPVAFLTVVGAAVATYVMSWAGWIFSDSAWGRQWAETNPATGLASLVPDWVRSLWHYHAEILTFHTTLTAEHAYASKPTSWLFLGRPVSFDYLEVAQGEQGCTAEKCAQEILALGTPALWWGGCIALVVCLAMWILRHDWRAGVAVLGVAAAWLPWFLYWDRTVFSFYAVAIAPFLVLAVTYALGLLLGPVTASPLRRTIGTAIAGAYVLLVLANSAWLYPIFVDQVIPHDAWRDRMWFRSWI
jgi:dolichyl-phosphate-mannose-protein mannosyltransferase